MTERRPAHEPVPDFVERQIEEARARGAFDDLPGHGRPQEGLDQPHDELWWLKRKLRDEHVSELPPALRAKVERDRAVDEALVAVDEEAVRAILEQVNTLIRRINRTTVHGPPTTVGPVDVDALVARWRTEPAGLAAAARSRDAALAAAEADATAEGAEAPATRLARIVRVLRRWTGRTR